MVSILFLLLLLLLLLLLVSIWFDTCGSLHDELRVVFNKKKRKTYFFNFFRKKLSFFTFDVMFNLTIVSRGLEKILENYYA